MAAQKSIPKRQAKRGRPPLTPGQAKRSSFNTRLRTSLKQLLTEEGAAAGRSLSEEIEFRLETSLLEKAADQREREAVVQGVYDAFGGEHRYKAMLFLANHWNFIEMVTKKKTSEDEVTMWTVRGAFNEFLDQYGPKVIRDTLLGNLEKSFLEAPGRESMAGKINQLRSSVKAQREKDGNLRGRKKPAKKWR